MFKFAMPHTCRCFTVSLHKVICRKIPFALCSENHLGYQHSSKNPSPSSSTCEGSQENIGKCASISWYDISSKDCCKKKILLITPWDQLKNPKLRQCLDSDGCYFWFDNTHLEEDYNTIIHQPKFKSPHLKWGPPRSLNYFTIPSPKYSNA